MRTHLNVMAIQVTRKANISCVKIYKSNIENCKNTIQHTKYNTKINRAIGNGNKGQQNLKNKYTNL